MHQGRVNMKKLFVGGLPKKIKETQLVKFLSQFGDVSRVFLKKKKYGHGCLGYGRILCDSITCSFFLSNQNEINFKGKKLTFKPFLEGNQLQNHLEDFNSKRIFIKNLPNDINNKQFINLISEYGKFETAYLRSISKNYNLVGIVIFTSKTQAEKMAQRINKESNGPFGRVKAAHKYFDSKTNRGVHKGNFNNIPKKSDGRTIEAQYQAERQVDQGYDERFQQEQVKGSGYDNRLFDCIYPDFQLEELEEFDYNDGIQNHYSLAPNDSPSNFSENYVPRMGYKGNKKQNCRRMAKKPKQNNMNKSNFFSINSKKREQKISDLACVLKDPPTIIQYEGCNLVKKNHSRQNLNFQFSNRELIEDDPDSEIRIFSINEKDFTTYHQYNYRKGGRVIARIPEKGMEIISKTTKYGRLLEINSTLFG